MMKQKPRRRRRRRIDHFNNDHRTSSTDFILISCVRPIQPIIAVKSETDYYRYLQQFGYTPKVEGRRLFSVVGKSSYREGVLKLQRLYKLPVSAFSSLDQLFRSVKL